jgi:DNA-3-methyladenine glycosylase I
MTDDDLAVAPPRSVVGSVARCGWAGSDGEMTTYHDTEWGFPVADDQRLFEKICLEGFQSGLSWRTILAKRPAFRKAFADFDFAVVAGYGESDVARLLGDAGIVRHRGKIEAAINNAGRALEMVEAEGSLAAFAWRYEATTPDVGAATTAESIALSRELKRRGWRFVGPTTAYAFMQAMGLVNDHEPGCFVQAEVAAARAAFTLPT